MAEIRTLSAKLNKHFAAVGAAAAAVTGLGLAQQAEAAVVYSGVQNVPIPATIDGVYLNVVTGATAAAGFAGFDINPYATSGATGGQSFFTSSTGAATATSRGYVALTTTGAAVNLTPGAIIDASATYNTGVSSSPTTFPAGTTGFLGFRFQNEATGNTVHFGWARILAASSSTVGTAGSVIDWGYESTPLTAIAAGAGIPEPTSLGLLAVGAAGLVARRRK